MVDIIGMEEELDLLHDILKDSRKLCTKFIDKVLTGRARSIETYNDCLQLMEKIDASFPKG